MKAAEVTIVNRLGLHARAAAKFVEVAACYSSDIAIEHDSQRVDGKNIMNVMLLAAGKGAQLTVIANGIDEIDALDAIVGLVESGFGED